MAPKAVKKPPVALVPIEKPISKSKKNKKKSYKSFAKYLYQILRKVSEQKIGITKTSMLVMNSFLHDMLEKIAKEAGGLVAHSKKNTLTSRDVASAVKFLVPGELGKHAHAEAMRSLQLYHNSQD